jgi:hypothetical protein
MGDFIRVGGLKNQEDFERLLAERFPEIAADIDDAERDLLHLEMAVFARATCKAIESGDLKQVQEHLQFADELLSDCGPDLENAIYVSYLENVFLRSDDTRYLSMQAILSERLQNALNELEEHWKAIGESNRRNTRSSAVPSHTESC